MKRITAITMFLAGLVAISTASAQDHAVKATIPFDFTVGNTLLPSGTYSVISDFPHVIEIRNNKQHVEVLSLVNTADKESKSGKLVFNRYGTQYFLSEILCSSAQMNLQLATSKLEKKVQHQEASLPSNDQTYVALK